jgi:hypothetical protein
VESDFKLDDGTIDRLIGELSDEFAERAGALADLFATWRKPEVARAVIDSLISDDRDAFRQLSEVELPVPVLDRCFWLVEVIEKVVPVPRTEVCRLRGDLSTEERRRYIAIVLEFRQRGLALPPIEPTSGGSGSSIGPIVPPGEFLEALRAEGLVTCGEEGTGGGLEHVIARPERMCV